MSPRPLREIVNRLFHDFAQWHHPGRWNAVAAQRRDGLHPADCRAGEGHQPQSGDGFEDEDEDEPQDRTDALRLALRAQPRSGNQRTGAATAGGRGGNTLSITPLLILMPDPTHANTMARTMAALNATRRQPRPTASPR